MQYQTNFSLVENPISEQARWISGGVGVDWKDMRTLVGNKLCGTQDGNQGAGVFNDSVACLTGTWGPTQTVQATVYNNLGAGGNYFTEVELHLCCTISLHSVATYEIGFGLNPATGGHYTGIARWNGAIGNVSTVASTITIPALVTGDIVKATIVGGLITAYINGVQVNQGTDASPLTGNPGFGHWLHNNGTTGDPTQYGFTLYSATDGLNNVAAGRARIMGRGAR